MCLLGNLPAHHRDPFGRKDPFDRMLVAQAQGERLPIVTRDPQIGKFGTDAVCRIYFPFFALATAAAITFSRSPFDHAS